MKKTKKKNRSFSKQKTIKRIPKINGHIIEKKEGWTSVYIFGEPFERGFAHGRLLYKELERNKKIFYYVVTHDMKTTMTKYLEMCKKQIIPIIQKKFPEFYEEIRGISAGCKSRGILFSTVELIGWNSIDSLHLQKQNNNLNNQEKCSAFIATGDATEKGDIIMAHNTHSDFILAQAFCITMYINPTKGHPFVMQTAAGFIASSTDWFICSTGIIGCETTITSVKYRPKFGFPYYCRIRKAMQYGKSLDDYIKIMKTKNAGDYACSWQLGDINTGEIMLLELGLREQSVQRTTNGVFYGMNSAMDIALRSKETNDQSHYDIETSSGSRNERLNQLLNKTYYGKINIENAKKIISDHYDVFLNKSKMGSRTICKHVELDPEKTHRDAFFPFGCIDGKVVNSKLARKLRFYGRFGSSCGRIFKVKDYIREHPEYENKKDMLEDFPRTEWTILSDNFGEP